MAALADGLGREVVVGKKPVRDPLGSTDYDTIREELSARTAALSETLVELNDRFADGTDDVAFRLATVDLFVEKAQRVLTERADRMAVAGRNTAVAALTVLAALCGYLVWSTLHHAANPSTNATILSVVSAISLGGVALVTVKWTIALSRSFFHESVSLLARRHALRFGRMYVYLNPTAIDLEELREAFDWNRGGDSSFLDIKPSEIAQTPWTAFASALGDSLAKNINGAARTVRRDK